MEKIIIIKEYWGKNANGISPFYPKIIMECTREIAETKYPDYPIMSVADYMVKFEIPLKQREHEVSLRISEADEILGTKLSFLAKRKWNKYRKVLAEIFDNPLYDIELPKKP